MRTCRSSSRAAAAQGDRRARQARQPGGVACGAVPPCSGADAAAAGHAGAAGRRAAFICRATQRLPVGAAPVVHLESDENQSEFVSEPAFRARWRRCEIEPQAGDGIARVRVLRDRVTERVLTVSARNIPTDYELTLRRAHLRSTARTARNCWPQEDFTLTRVYSFDERKLLAKEHEKDLLLAALGARHGQCRDAPPGFALGRRAMPGERDRVAPRGRRPPGAWRCCSHVTALRSSWWRPAGRFPAVTGARPKRASRAMSLYARPDTPLHSVLHEAASLHLHVARAARGLDRDAGGDDAEECAVCYLQISEPAAGGRRPGARRARTRLRRHGRLGLQLPPRDHARVVRARRRRCARLAARGTAHRRAAAAPTGGCDAERRAASACR